MRKPTNKAEAQFYLGADMLFGLLFHVMLYHTGSVYGSRGHFGDG